MCVTPCVCQPVHPTVRLGYCKPGCHEGDVDDRLSQLVIQSARCLSGSVVVIPYPAIQSGRGVKTIPIVGRDRPTNEDKATEETPGATSTE